MENDRLSPELEALEGQVAARDCSRLPGGLRDRVMDGLQVELRRDRRRKRWTFAAQAAAAAVLWINLSLSITQSTNLGLELGTSPPSVDALAQQVQEILPDISQRETRRQALLLQASWNLAEQPDFSKCSITSNGLHESLDDFLSNGG